VKTGQTFYQYVGASVAQNGGVPSAQAALFQSFASIGLTSSGYTASTNSGTLSDINTASTDALSIISAIGASGSNTGWQASTTNGQYGASYSGWLAAATTARDGLGANLAPEATYPSTHTDSNGLPLSGSNANAYTISFPAGDLPPVSGTGGWWSITVYNQSGFVVNNTGSTFYGANEYSLGSNQLENILGSAYDSTAFSIYLSSQAPTDPALLPYWLPVPATNFELALRIYLPDGTEDESSILNGTYTVPSVVQTGAVPEPGSYALFGLGFLAAIAIWHRRRRIVA
jgi:hypothetical protein